MPAAASDISDIKPVGRRSCTPPAGIRRGQKVSPHRFQVLSVASAAERLVDHVFMLDTRCAATTENVRFLSERR